MAMIVYGLLRFAVAKYKHQENPNIHILWIPGAAFLYAASVTVVVLSAMA